ncbi:2-polyprenyl-3-methyl-6-methoxy-1,4-benzoquinone monooxygenase [Thioalkalivibrio sp.]|uniref:2-polyprenyl-3-methyl-6-methoxy-1,4-benzoquinone monooxygenase n=1 Tax=Thioalkalivibrio sp. TaxID=2093813 RepID=UPI003563B25C
MRRLSPLDHLINQADAFVKVVAGQARSTGRPSPGGDDIGPHLGDHERDRSARLMRVNHAGEVAAQGLYQGQMLTARNPEIRGHLDQASREEGDHLHWCARRVHDLGGRTSLLGPFWYVGSFGMGALAGLTGDAYSLGFIDETERQVERHLDRHLERLPAQDEVSARILAQMKQDEVEHGAHAMALGGKAPPWPVRNILMPLTSSVMTRTAYWI